MLRYFRVTFYIWAGIDCLFIFIANVKAFHIKSVMIKPQTEGKVRSRLYSRTQEKKFKTLQQ